VDSSATRPTVMERAPPQDRHDKPRSSSGTGYRSFKAERRVRLPHGVLCSGRRAFGMWESLAIRLPWEQENAGSNPAIPTQALKRLTSSIQFVSRACGKASGRAILPFCRVRLIRRGESCGAISILSRGLAADLLLQEPEHGVAQLDYLLHLELPDADRHVRAVLNVDRLTLVREPNDGSWPGRTRHQELPPPPPKPPPE
jgi:hypothetical protein